MVRQTTVGRSGGALLRAHEFFRRGPASPEGWSQLTAKDRGWESFYRERWQHDKVVRSTHGVNCTGSCSWNVYVKDGLVTWETQAVDYPSTGPGMPEYEPRGCPRGASFSWYVYSPIRLRYPYIRGSLIEMYRAERERLGDPVDAWAAIVDDPERRRTYTSQRGRGGFVRAGWDEAVELIAAAHVHTIKRHGPDRIAGFTPIPAMSMASYAGGTRFLSLIGGVVLSFYDWYCDLPPASPQTFGDQTDVPESGDWWNAGYLLVWGTNLPTTRTPDAHFMTEARYRGQKVVVVSPDYAEHTKFADRWLAAHPGTDGALAMAMGHVILREFWVDRDVPYFRDYGRRFTDMPLLVTLREHGDGHVADRFLTASDLADARRERRLEDRRPRRGDRCAGRPERLRGLPLGRGEGPLEPAPRRDPAGAHAARPRRCRGRRRRHAPVRRGRDRRRLVGAAGRPRDAGGRPSRDHRARPHAGPVRRRPRRAPRRVAGGIRRRRLARHARLAGAAHVGLGRRLRAHRPRVRAERRADRGPLHDRDGRRHEPLVPLRPDLPHVPGACPHVRLPGPKRRRLGALRGPGEGAAAHRLSDARVRARLGAAAAAHGLDAVLRAALGPVALRGRAALADRLAARDGGVRRPPGARHGGARGPARMDAVVPELRPLEPRSGRRGREGRRRSRRPRRLEAPRRVAALRLRGSRTLPATILASSPSGGRTCSGRRARATSTS